MTDPRAGRLVLVKHSLPEVLRGSPAREWRLSVEGKRRCLPLARRLAPYTPGRVVSSLEPKAVETAAIVARELGVTATTQAGLHEQERSGVGWLARADLEAGVRALFDHPGELVFGEETANRAHARFAAAVEELLSAAAGETVALVAHGTVISLYLSRACGLDPFGLWRTLGLPSFAVLSLPGLDLVELVTELRPQTS